MLTYQIQEDLYVLERELDYYRVADAGVNQLYTVAQELFAQTDVDATEYSYLHVTSSSHLEAAKEAVSAARHLIKAARGF